MGKKILVLCMVIALLILLPVFSYAVEPPVGTEILEYIQSSGTQYINSDFLPNQDTKIVVDVQSVGINEADTGQSFFGARDGSDKRFFTFWHRTQNSYYYYFYNTNVNASSSRITDRIIVTANKNTLTIGDSITLTIPTYSNFSLSKPVYLFATNLDGTADYFGVNRLYSSQLYDGSSLSRDYIPVRMNGNVGLWDKVEGEFYGNAGTGVFIGGPVVEVVVPPDPEYNITVSDDGNGSASSNVSTATAGTTVTLTATPANGYVFSEWQVLQGDVNIVNNQFIMPSSDVSVKAVFVPDGAHSVTVQNDGFGTGSANPVRAQAGDRITLSVVPALGYEFDKWQVVTGSVNISNNQFIMPDSDVVVKALFKPIVYTITLNQSPNGTATVSQQTGIIGDVITLTATPNEYYNFLYWDVTQGGITVDGNSFTMPASNVVLTPVFVKQSAVSSGFEYHSGAISGEEESEFALIDVDFGEQPAGEYLLNIYHWGFGCNPTFQISYNDKYLPFVTTGGVSTVSILHDGGKLVLDGNLSLVKNLLQTAEGTITWVGDYGNGNLQFHTVSSWSFNVEDVVAVPIGLANSEDFGIYSSIVSFLKSQFNDIKSFLTEQIGRIAGDEEAESDVSKAEEELNKEVEDLNNLGGQLEEQQTSLETQFESDFKVSDDITAQTSTFQGIYTGIFSSFGIFSIFIWLPVVLAVIKKLLRL